MSRYVIVTLPGAPPAAADSFAGYVRVEAAPAGAGCAWLFAAAAEVEDPETALRRAVTEFFRSPQGERIRRGEELTKLGWCDAIPWVPDETWARHGLTAFRHPEVERILLDEQEDLAEEDPVAGAVGASVTARANGSMPTRREGAE
jgi:hypothetical protein